MAEKKKKVLVNLNEIGDFDMTEKLKKEIIKVVENIRDKNVEDGKRSISIKFSFDPKQNDEIGVSIEFITKLAPIKKTTVTLIAEDSTEQLVIREKLGDNDQPGQQNLLDE
ncbi:MAG: hypothetical protein LKF43_00340 [Streptococcaceae bacterium]|jgi:hypothetical protein|nr:hypothetical protein [Streptococcaceae bacterium]